MTVNSEERALLTTVKTPSQWLLLIVFGVIPFGLGIYSLIGLSQLDKWPTLPPNPPNFVTQAIPFFFILMFVEIVAYFILGKKSTYRLNDTVSSISMGTVQQLVGIFIKSLQVFPYAYIRQQFTILHWDDEENISWTHPVWWAMLIVVELGYYWLHRLAHEWNALWAGHIVHHSSEDYNLSTALRQGAWQPVFGWVFYLTAAPFFPIQLFMFHGQVNTLYQCLFVTSSLLITVWIHTQVIDKFPYPIELIFNTPSHHRVHHGRNAQYLDKNYGGTLIIFDRLFGTFEPEVEEPVYGITHYLGTWNIFYLQTHQFDSFCSSRQLGRNVGCLSEDVFILEQDSSVSRLWTWLQLLPSASGIGGQSSASTNSRDAPKV